MAGSQIKLFAKTSAAAILLVQVGEQIPALPDGTPVEFVRWATIQGAVFVALILVLWSYRRDLAGMLKEERGRISALIDLVEKSTTAHERSAAAITANEKALHRLARSIELLDRGIAPHRISDTPRPLQDP